MVERAYEEGSKGDWVFPPNVTNRTLSPRSWVQGLGLGFRVPQFLSLLKQKSQKLQKDTFLLLGLLDGGSLRASVLKGMQFLTVAASGPGSRKS